MVQQEIGYRPPSQDEAKTRFAAQEKRTRRTIIIQRKQPTAKHSARIGTQDQGDCKAAVVEQSMNPASERSPVSRSLKRRRKSNVGTNQELQQSRASPPHEASTEVESKDQLRLFISVVIVKVLSECNFIKNRSEQEWILHTKMLVNETVEKACEKLFADLKWTKKVCKSVVKDLRKKFGGRRLLEHMMLLKDPAVDAAIVRSVIVHHKELADKMEGKQGPRSVWKDVLQCFAVIVCVVGAIALMLLIP